MKKLFLHSYHSDSGAIFKDVERYSIPKDYGNVLNEVDAINKTIGLLDRSYLGKILVQGKDSLDLLNRISTNDLQYLSIGTVCDTIFVTPKGRMIDYCRIISIGENQFILICSFINTNHLMDWINRFIILEDVELKDVTNEYVWLTLLGPQCKAFLNKYSKSAISEGDDAIWLEYNSVHFPAFKNTNFIVSAYNFCFTNTEAKQIFTDLLTSIHEWNGSLIGDTAFQIIRIESGMPDWGTEITEDYNPHEARLLNAVSFTKGCYTGQEVIARLDTYDKVQKYLMIFEFDSIIDQETPIDVYLDDEKIGILTSYIFNPIDEIYIGLGYIKKMYSNQNDLFIELNIVKEHKDSSLLMENYLKDPIPSRRIPARFKNPPMAY